MLIVAAGPLVAAASRSDRNHLRCVELLTHAPRPLVVPALVVTEVAYFLADRIGVAAERAFATSLRPARLDFDALHERRDVGPAHDGSRPRPGRTPKPPPATHRRGVASKPCRYDRFR